MDGERMSELTSTSVGVRSGSPAASARRLLLLLLLLPLGSSEGILFLGSELGARDARRGLRQG
jgi:hypothetical protein